MPANAARGVPAYVLGFVALVARFVGSVARSGSLRCRLLQREGYCLRDGVGGFVERVRIQWCWQRQRGGGLLLIYDGVQRFGGRVRMLRMPTDAAGGLLLM